MIDSLCGPAFQKLPDHRSLLQEEIVKTHNQFSRASPDPMVDGFYIRDLFTFCRELMLHQTAQLSGMLAVLFGSGPLKAENARRHQSQILTALTALAKINPGFLNSLPIRHISASD